MFPVSFAQQLITGKRIPLLSLAQAIPPWMAGIFMPRVFAEQKLEAEKRHGRRFSANPLRSLYDTVSGYKR
jgi:hypothetical protein